MDPSEPAMLLHWSVVQWGSLSRMLKRSTMPYFIMSMAPVCMVTMSEDVPFFCGGGGRDSITHLEVEIKLAMGKMGEMGKSVVSFEWFSCWIIKIKGIKM